MDRVKRQIKNLWELCFADGEEFRELYFRLRYNNNVNIAIENEGQVVAALQMLPYPMTFGGQEIETAYVSGACTHPDYRNRGIMGELLSWAFMRMLYNGNALSALIPAEPWLFDYYARYGYAPVFKYKTNTFVASDVPVSGQEYVLRVGEQCKGKRYEYLNGKLRERAYCMQHTQADFRVILADLRLGGGYIYTLRTKASKLQAENDTSQGKTRIVALAVAYPTGSNKWRIGEIVSDNPETHALLLRNICRELNVPSVEVLAPLSADEVGEPLGMARIINAKAMLDVYAAIHPETEICIRLADEQISENNAYFHLSGGKCIKNAKRLPGSHLALTVGELTEKIFETSNPYMSLMMN
ncbi:MAG TPA: GNAT family N-acetyltransferase [Prevotella sp.]